MTNWMNAAAIAAGEAGVWPAFLPLAAGAAAALVKVATHVYEAHRRKRFLRDFDTLTKDGEKSLKLIREHLALVAYLDELYPPANRVSFVLTSVWLGVALGFALFVASLVARGGEPPQSAAFVLVALVLSAVFAAGWSVHNHRERRRINVEEATYENYLERRLLLRSVLLKRCEDEIVAGQLQFLGQNVMPREDDLRAALDQARRELPTVPKRRPIFAEPRRTSSQILPMTPLEKMR